MKVSFPSQAGGLKRNMLARYYKVYYGFVLESLKYAGAHIQLCGNTAIGDAKYTITVDGQEVVIDYSDHLQVADGFQRYPYYFKFHYSEEIHREHPNLYSFSPVCFYDWDQYDALQGQISYSCKGDMILNRQKPHANALQRRREVQSMLTKKYGKNVVTRPTGQIEFWKEISNCLVSVCVPGSRNNMLDRGQLQYMAFGACTISPQLITQLPRFEKLQPGVHYISCKDDYSDLQDKIEWCRSNRQACIEIGRNAKHLFQNTATPQKLWEWVRQTISG